MKKKADGTSDIPKWIPCDFEDLFSGISLENYGDLMMKHMAADLRIVVLSLGKALVKCLRSRKLTANKQIKKILDNLVLFYVDPIYNEENIFNTQEELLDRYKIRI